MPTYYLRRTALNSSSSSGENSASLIDDDVLPAPFGKSTGLQSAGADAVATAPATAAEATGAGASGLTFTNSYSLDGTFSTLTAAERNALETDLLTAEANYSSLFTNSVNIKFDLEAVNQPSAGFLATNEASAFVYVTLSQYFTALQSVDNSTYQQSSLAAVKSLNLGANSYIGLPSAYAAMLGLASAGQVETNSSMTLGSQTLSLSAAVDDTLVVNVGFMRQALDAQASNTANAGVVGVLEHEMSEEAMGRISFLDVTDGGAWSPLDFYRVDSSGQSDMTADNNSAVFFSPDPNQTAPVSALQFNNETSNGDFADWTTTATSDPNYSDPFGAGGFNGAVGTETATLSPTDIDIMNVLGWDLASSGGTPSLTIALADDTGVSSTDGLTDSAALTGTAAAYASLSFYTSTGANVGSTTATAGGSWSFSSYSTAPPDGANTVTVVETYGSGQTASASLSFTLATQAPSVSASESVSGQTSQTSDLITVSATSETVAGNGVAGVEIFDGNADLGAATYANGVWTYNAANLLPGVHDFVAKAADKAGNTASAALAPVTVVGSGPTPNSRYTISEFGFSGDGVTDIRPKGVNDSGEIVGYYLDSRADQTNSDDQIVYEHGFGSTISDGTRSYVTLDNPLAASPLVQTRVMGLNDKGEFVGWYAQSGDDIASNGQIYRLPAAGYIDSGDWPGGVGSLAEAATGDFGTHALGISDNDSIVGFYYDGGGEQHGFLREFTGYGVRGDYVTLDPTSSINTVAEGVNDGGEVVGFYETSNLVYHGFSYDSSTGAYTSLDVNGAADTYILGVNDSGETVGYYLDRANEAHGFVASASGQLTLISDPNASAAGTEVSGIANDGEIVGWYTGADGHSHGFVGTANTHAAPADFNGDGKSDILWYNTNGDTYLWNSTSSGGFTGQDFGVVNTSWQITETGHFSADGLSDILWRNTNGDTYLWNSTGSGGFTGEDIGVVNTSWQIAGVGDFSGDGRSDILWRNANGDTYLWNSNGSGGFTGQDIGVVDPSWKIAAVGDFNGDGKSDILWRNTNGDTYVWNSTSSGGFTGQDLGYVPTSWTIAA